MPKFSISSTAVGALAALAVASAASPTASFAQTQIPAEMRSEAIALMQACRSDYERLCGGVIPGGGRILACLQSQANQLSPVCGQAMPRAQSLRDSAVAAGVMPR